MRVKYTDDDGQEQEVEGHYRLRARPGARGGGSQEAVHLVPAVEREERHARKLRPRRQARRRHHPDPGGRGARTPGPSLSDDPEVEGHAFTGVKLRDPEGNEYDLPADRIVSIKWTDEQGEHEVEGHGFKFRVLSQEPEVEGHGGKVRFLDQNGQEHEVDAHAAKIRWRDDSGQEQEVEGHLSRWSDLRLKHRVEPLRNALAQLGTITTEGDGLRGH